MDGIIADGAIRSGKTVSMSLSFVIWDQVRSGLQLNQYLLPATEQRAIAWFTKLSGISATSSKNTPAAVTNFIGVFFQRYILGLWVLAEGVIYHNFNRERHCINKEDIPSNFDYYYVSSDYGITNPQVFLLCGVKYIRNKPHVWILKEYYNQVPISLK